MPEKYAPKHRGAPPRHRGLPPQRLRSGAKKAIVIPGIAVLATGLTVSAGLAAHGESSDGVLVNLSAGTTQLTAADLAEREKSASRSSEREVATTSSLKAAELGTTTGVAVTRTEDLTESDPKTLTKALMPQYGLASADFDCIDRIWTQESNWNVHADNPHSSAYGIPQALPGKKMATAGADWHDSAETQIRWGLGYIQKRYGSACSAWSFKSSHGWY
ncbi:MAG: hypothetical protein JWQ74_1006 [Marmoricola sp.]|nr:hypothetical protein [Marmoricola sp.]